MFQTIFFLLVTILYGFTVYSQAKWGHNGLGALRESCYMAGCAVWLSAILSEHITAYQVGVVLVGAGWALFAIDVWRRWL